MKGNRETIQDCTSSNFDGENKPFCLLCFTEICDFSQNYFGDDSTRKLGQQMAENW